jgi:hypothetical protein
MSRKRARVDDHVVTFEDAATAIGSIVAGWTDVCGVSLHVQQKLKNDRQKLLQQLLEFESLNCKTIHTLIDATLPGDFCIQSLFCVSSTRSIDITIVRRQLEISPSVMPIMADLTAEIVRMRIATGVASEDIPHVKDAIASLLRSLPASSNWVVSAQPNCYNISFSKVATLGTSAVTIASRLSETSIYDFENAVLNVQIKKITPEITF